MKQNARYKKIRSAAKPLEKGIQIIEFLAGEGYAIRGVREVAGAVGVSPATASRILRIFLDAGWVERSGERTKAKYAIAQMSKRYAKGNGQGAFLQGHKRKV